MNKISLTRADLEAYAVHHSGFHGLEIRRISSVLIAQVIQMDANRVINTRGILDVVNIIEDGGPGATRKIGSFKRPPLKGLKKVHFIDSSFLLRNLGAYLGYENGGNKKLDKIIKRAFEKNTSGEVDEEFILYIAHHATIGALEERRKSGKMTGEWIVFQEFELKNYYLTLAAHDEGDDVIYGRVCDAYDLDFPFLHGNS